MEDEKVVVTTTREFRSEIIREDLITKAKSVAHDLQLEYIDRENYSINAILEKYNAKQLIIIEKDKIIIKDKENELFWHPNIAELKIKSIKKGNKESIVEATKLCNGDIVLDCTLGLGCDAIILSSIIGKEGMVVGTEINKYIAYITKHGIENYRITNNEFKDNMGNIEVVNESYESFLLKQEDNSFDVVYFDPMFQKPNKKSSSLNSFRDFAEHKVLNLEIIREAIRVCRKRVVIKERRGYNNFHELGIEKVYGSKKNGAIIYGVIDKHINEVK